MISFIESGNYVRDMYRPAALAETWTEAILEFRSGAASRSQLVDGAARAASALMGSSTLSDLGHLALDVSATGHGHTIDANTGSIDAKASLQIVGALQSGEHLPKIT